ncbi:DUF6538 domain-containing protein [Brevundimonas staleyi]|uniref:DUF6538 domain-containing protein n=1 Tax=Brevundimonas staleyi TaxID=74326 RepID=A0ABW0FUV7_9CAUL
MPLYLSKRNGTYYFRRVIPDHLQPVIGKQQFMWSLRTKDFAEAKRRRNSDATKTDGELERAEAVSKLPLSAGFNDRGEDVRTATLETEHDNSEILHYAALIAASYRRDLEAAAKEGLLEAKKESLQGELSKHEWNLKDGSLIDRFSLSTSESMAVRRVGCTGARPNPAVRVERSRPNPGVYSHEECSGYDLSEPRLPLSRSSRCAVDGGC